LSTEHKHDLVIYELNLRLPVAMVTSKALHSQICVQLHLLYRR
jgi:hypothetical protein